MTHKRTDTYNERCCAFWYLNDRNKYEKIGSNKRIKDHKIYIAQVRNNSIARIRYDEYNAMSVLFFCQCLLH